MANRTFNSHLVLKRDGVILHRSETTACANVPQLITYHSPDGFEWGYGGSGPAELALNILFIISDGNRDLADRLHQDFKSEFIATMPHEGGKIGYATMMDWLKERIGNG